MNLKRRLILILLAFSFIIALMFHFTVNSSALDHFKVSHTGLYILANVAVILLLGALLYLLIEKYLTRRISRITREMQNVRGLDDVARRIETDTIGDEISSLIHSINVMLENIAREKEERERVEQALLTNEKLVSIGRLSAGIAHEINNPILAISNCLQALKKTVVDGRKTDPALNKKAITISETEISRIREIISSLLDYHRMEKEAFSRINLADVLDQSLEILKWSKKLRSMSIETRLDGNYQVYGSVSKLKQVFINFILNAVEAGFNGHNGNGNGNKNAMGDDGVNRRKPSLTISAAPSADNAYCEIHLVDNGPGINDAIKGKLFEPFVSTKGGRGVGLGLYVSYKIIRTHRGDIIYNDDHRDGAHFIIRLPLVKDNARDNARPGEDRP